MNNTKFRLLQVFENQQIKIVDVVKKISVSKKYFNTKSAISSNYLEGIAKIYPEINMDWVITGRGEMTFVTNKTAHMNKRFGESVIAIMNAYGISEEDILKEAGENFSIERLKKCYTYQNEIDLTVLYYLDKITGNSFTLLFYNDKPQMTEQEKNVLQNSADIFLPDNGKFPEILFGPNNEKTQFELFNRAADYRELAKENSDIPHSEENSQSNLKAEDIKKMIKKGN